MTSGFLQAVGRFLLALIAVVSLVGAIWLGLNDRVPAGSLLASLGLLLLAFVQLSRFKRIKGLGFEAELWEDKQEEAAELINQTRALLKILSAAMLRSAPRMGRLMAGFDRREQLTLATDIESALKKAGVPEAEFAGMRDEIDRLIAWDLAEPITRAVTDLVRARAEAFRQDMHRRFGSPITDLDGYNEAHRELQQLNASAIDPNWLADFPQKEWADRLRERVDSIPFTDGAAKVDLLRSLADALADLSAWTTDRAIRRPEVFFSKAKG